MGQIHRFATLSSNKTDFDQICREAFKSWKDCGYSYSFLRSCKSKVLKNLNRQIHFKPGFYSCNSPICVVCKYALYSQVLSTKTGMALIKHRITCKSMNAIYLISCANCSQRYIGQTGRTLATRIKEHLYGIRTNKDHNVSRHFSVCGIESFRFTGIDVVTNLSRRLLKENKWIQRYDSLHPNGLNERLNKSKQITCILPHSELTNRLKDMIKGIVPDTVFGYTRSENLEQLLR